MPPPPLTNGGIRTTLILMLLMLASVEGVKGQGCHGPGHTWLLPTCANSQVLTSPGAVGYTYTWHTCNGSGANMSATIATTTNYTATSSINQTSNYVYVASQGRCSYMHF